MKNQIILSTALSSILLVNLNATENLEEIKVITATKTEKNIEGVSASVEVITQKDIEKMGAESLKDIIKKTSGLYVQYGTFPSASAKSKSSLTIRGMSANGTLFLLDGRRLSGEVKNPFDLDRIPASLVQRIEIVKGPMSSLYGADAVGGVINIITKKPSSKPEINLGIRYGQNSKGDAKNKNASLSIRGTKDKFKYSIYANKTKTTPYTQDENANVLVKAPKSLVPTKTFQKTKPSLLTVPSPLPTKMQGLGKGINYLKNNLPDTYTNQAVTYLEESDVNTIGGRFSYDLSDETIIGFDINAFDEERNGSYIGYFHPSKFKLPIFNIPVNSKDENSRIDVGADFTTSLSEDLYLKLRAYKSYYKKRNTTTAKYYKQLGFSSEKESASNGMNANVDIRSYEGILNYSLNDNHLFTFGLERRDEKRDATVFDNTPNMTRKSVDYSAVYLQDEWMIADDLNAIIGGRYDKVSNAKNKFTLRLGLVKNFSKLLNLRFNFAQGYRTPDIREMYINKQTPNGLQQGADVIGYDLKPEFTNSYEIGLNGRNNNFSYNVSLFYNDIKDRISQINKTKYYTFENISNANTKGLELDLNYDFTSTINAGLTYTELRTEDEKTNKQLEFNPKRSFGANINFNPTKNLGFSTIVKYIGEQAYTQNMKDKTTNDYTLIDVNANYKINKNFEIYGGIDNIFDKEVDDILGSNAGRYYFSGLRISF